MKKTLFLLATLAGGVPCLAQAPKASKTDLAKPKVKTIFNSELLAQMLNKLPTHLRTVYSKAGQVKKVAYNKYDPAIQDTILIVSTKADKLELFTNKYNAFLLSAHITSQRLTFGQGIRIGALKSAFCKAYNLPASFDIYQVTDEAQSSLCFIFRQGELAEITYAAGQLE